MKNYLKMALFNQLNLKTERLFLKPLEITDAEFILKLLNTDGWIKFIGDRKIHSIEDANNYIERITKNENVHYWVVTNKFDNEALGLVTLIKRDYLQHHDIGFAFLPYYNGKGYAYEAAKQLLDYCLTNANLTAIDACTVPENVSSIKLLEKLGLKFKEQITHENELLSIYSTA